MSLENFYTQLPKKYKPKKYYNPNKLMPQHPFRLCIVGASNTGKTNTLMNIIDKSKSFYKIYLYAKKLDEPLYQCFIDTWLDKSKETGVDLITFSNDFNDTVKADDVDENVQNLIIFDDMVTESNLSRVSELFIRGRKNNCSIIFISQSYFGIPTQVRINSDYFIFTRNLKGNELLNVAKDHGGCVTINEFKKMYIFATKEGYNFFMIDLQQKDNKYRFRKNFDYSLTEIKKL